MTEEHDVRITLKEVYHQQQEQGRVLLQMSSDLKRFLDSHDRVKEQVADHEDRIRVMERKIWQASGVAAFLGTVGGVLVNMLVK